MKPRSSKHRRIRGLNGLRTLALFGVLLFHMFPRAVPGGYFGVILFFVISGFLTACSSCASRTMDIRSYYARRAKRIYPSLVIMLFVTVEVLAAADRFRLANAQEEILSVLLAYNNYWQISKSADYFANLASNSAFTHLWYIAILIQYEIIWPWLYRFARRRHNSRTIGRIALISLFIMPVLSFIPSVPSALLYYGTLSRIHALLLGSWLGWRYSESKQTSHVKPSVSLLYIILFTAVTILICFTVPGSDLRIYRFGMVLYAAACCAAVRLLCDERNPVGIALDRQPFEFFSKYSYEIYLWQYPVLFLFTIKGWNTNPGWYLLQFAVLLVLSIWTNFIVGRLFRR